MISLKADHEAGGDMKFSLLIILTIFSFFNCPTFAAKSAYEELTGKKPLTRKDAPKQILELARDAKWKKDYITAIKRYNTLIVKFPKAPEVRKAYLDKAQLYKEMGLKQQSQYNLEKAKK